MPDNPELDSHWMTRALELAAHGEGYVEPNPMVGCVIVKDGELIGTGFHHRFGEVHAEVDALSDAAKKHNSVNGATAYVTLEPCSHIGKTGPCADALIQAKIARVVIGIADPFPAVSGQGISRIREAGISVSVGVEAEKCAALTAPFLKQVQQSHPWIIAKWAMSLDGKIATQSGESQWISNPTSRQKVQQLRGRVDAIMVGTNTVLTDDPMLNARPDDPVFVKRIATRVVPDSRLRVPLDSKLVQSADQFPVLIACGPEASAEKSNALRKAGCEVWQCDDADPGERLNLLLQELGQRGMTNVLVEGGGHLVGSLHDRGWIDEVHVFLGPKLIGNPLSSGPVGGQGIEHIDQATQFRCIRSDVLENDIYAIYRKL